MAIDLKYGYLEIPGIADDEPVFVLRAQDDLATQTIEDYIGWCEYEEVNPEHVEAADSARRAFCIWQETHATRMPG